MCLGQLEAHKRRKELHQPPHPTASATIFSTATPIQAKQQQQREPGRISGNKSRIVDEEGEVAVKKRQ